MGLIRLQNVDVLDVPHKELILPNKNLIGSQVPRIEVGPEVTTGSGLEAVELAAAYGLNLDPWQQHLLINSLGENQDGTWLTPTVAWCVPRQNGKTAVLEAVCLASLLLFEEEMTLFSSHLVPVSLEMFSNLKAYFANYDDLRRKATVVNRNGYEEINVNLPGGKKARLKFVARMRNTGRGLPVDRLIMDEAQELTAETMASLQPTMSSRPNPQIIMTGTAPGAAARSETFGKVRADALSGHSKDLYYAEWSAEADTDLDDKAGWLQANPALGKRLSDRAISAERSSLSDDAFAQERLGIWGHSQMRQVIPDDMWAERGWEEIIADDAEIAIGIDVSPDRTATSIVLCAMHKGKYHLEVVKQGVGVAWVPEFVSGLYHRRNVRAVVIDTKGPAGSTIEQLKSMEVPVTQLNMNTMVHACGLFYDLTISDEIRHFRQNELTNAVSGARKRKLLDAWAWHRQSVNTDITPLVAATEALYGMTVASPASLTNKAKKAPSISTAFYGFN